jgi:hypothetical protein
LIDGEGVRTKMKHTAALSISLLNLFLSRSAFAQTYLVCTNVDNGQVFTASIYRDNRQLVYQEASVVMKHGSRDQFGGIAAIRETPAQYRIEYQNTTSGFSSVTTIDRVTGRYWSSSKSNKPMEFPAGFPSSLADLYRRQSASLPRRSCRKWTHFCPSVSCSLHFGIHCNLDNGLSLSIFDNLCRPLLGSVCAGGTMRICASVKTKCAIPPMKNQRKTMVRTTRRAWRLMSRFSVACQRFANRVPGLSAHIGRRNV